MLGATLSYVIALNYHKKTNKQTQDWLLWLAVGSSWTEEAVVNTQQ